MPRILGIDLPKKKKLPYALCAIYGIGISRARSIVQELGFDEEAKAETLTSEAIAKVTEYIKQFTLEGDLRREQQSNIQRLMQIKSYRGLRHRLRQPVRGQRTRTNARTRKGKKKTVAGKKKATK